MKLVEGDNLCIGRGRQALFTATKFCVRQGGHVALLGANGVGKSTLLEVFAGFLRPISEKNGQLSWAFGEDVGTSPLIARRHARLCSPAQQSNYVRNRWLVTGREIILSGLSNELLLYGPQNEAEKNRADALGQQAGVAGLLDKTLPSFSQGQLRLLLLLRAFVSEPMLLLLDEPFDGLSKVRRQVLHRLLEQAVEGGCTVVITAHRLHDIPACIQTVVAVQNKENATGCFFEETDFAPLATFAEKDLAMTGRENTAAIEDRACVAITNQTAAQVKSAAKLTEMDANEAKAAGAAGAAGGKAGIKRGEKQLQPYGLDDFGSKEHDWSIFVRLRGEAVAKEVRKTPKTDAKPLADNRGNAEGLARSYIGTQELSSALFDKRPLCARFLQGRPPSHLPKGEGNISAQPIVSLQQINVFVERAHVLRDLCWCVQPRENWIICGENGAGKSTLFRLLYGDEVAAYGGQIVWCGHPRPPLALWRQHVAVVSDTLQYTYSYDLPALQLVLSGRSGTIGLYDEPLPEEIQRAKRWLHWFGLTAVTEKRYTTLSTGLKRRVLLARAMMCSPALLLLDEPCSALDTENRNIFLKSLEWLAQLGVQMLYISHNEADTPTFFTHELVLSEGSIAKAGNRETAAR